MTRRFPLLIVDDDSVDRTAVRRLLARGGLRESTIPEAANATRRDSRCANAEATSVDCVILDYHLAGETGLDVLDDMRVEHPNTACVVLTGRSDPETAAALIKAGALEFLTQRRSDAERLEQAIRVGDPRLSRANVKRT